MIAYQFPENLEDRGYKIFPEDLEKARNIYFHGTSEINFESILQGGFKILGDVPSLSFSNESSLALRYACEKRDALSPNGVVLAIQYPQDLDFIKHESFGIHVYRTDIQPQIIGYCIIPKDYQHF